MKIDFFCISNCTSILLQLWQILLPFLLLGLSFSIKIRSDASFGLDKRMKQLKTSHALVLAIWAGVNLLIGGIFMFTSADKQLFYLHAMNGYWGLVNLAVAKFVYSHHNEVFNQPQTLLQQDHQRHAEKIIIFNIGLDIAFIASGIALQQHGQDSDISYPALWKGFGTSVIIQGAF